MDTREQLIQRAQAREELNRRQIIKRCREWVISHDAGPMYWLRSLTCTENFHWKEQGRSTAKEPFPYKPYPKRFWNQERLDLLQKYFPHRLTLDDPPDYLDVAMGFLLMQTRIDVPKSREMMSSWEVCGYGTWRCQFFEGVEFIGQSEKDDKAQGLVKYANTLYENQPEWLRSRFPLKRGDEGTKHALEFAHGSRFIGVPQGARQVASFHPTIYFNDESAHQPEYLSTLSVVAPVAKQIICISSAAPGDFGDEAEMPAAVTA